MNWFYHTIFNAISSPPGDTEKIIAEEISE